MKKSSKIILTSLIIGTMSIAGTAMAEAASKKPVPIPKVSQNFEQTQKRPPAEINKFEGHGPRSDDRRMPPRSGDRTPPPPKPNDKPNGKTPPPPPPSGKNDKVSSNMIINIILNQKALKI